MPAFDGTTSGSSSGSSAEPSTDESSGFADDASSTSAGEDESTDSSSGEPVEACPDVTTGDPPLALATRVADLPPDSDIAQSWDSDWWVISFSSPSNETFSCVTMGDPVECDVTETRWQMWLLVPPDQLVSGSHEVSGNPLVTDQIRGLYVEQPPNLSQTGCDSFSASVYGSVAFDTVFPEQVTGRVCDIDIDIADAVQFAFAAGSCEPS